MKVIHVITGLNDGGAEGALFRLIGSSHQDIDYKVISLMDEGKYGAPLKALGVDVISLNMPRGNVKLLALWRLFRILKTERPDVVQTWMYHADFFGGILAKLSGCKAIYWGVRHADLSLGANSKSTLLLAKLCTFLSTWVPNKIITCAEESVIVHKKFGYKGCFKVIPNGYDTEKFRPNKAAAKKIRDELGLAEPDRLIGFVARWDVIKDHKNLLQAMSKVKKNFPNTSCILIGSDCDESNVELTNLLSLLGLNDDVILLGRRNDIPDVMNALDIHVLSSSGEAFPNVVAEAMASGTPCVVTDVGDAALIVGDTGWITPPKNSCLLTDAIELALCEIQSVQNWEVRKQACANRINEQFSLLKMVSAYKNTWYSNN